MRRTRRGLDPRNEYRPRRSPPATLSSRKLGLSSRIFRYAETGVSRSARISRDSATLFPSSFAEERSVRDSEKSPRKVFTGSPQDPDAMTWHLEGRRE